MIRFYGWDGTLLLIQFCAVLFVFGWTTVVFTPFTFFLKFINCLRIDALEEEVGMDISRHKGPAYRTDGVDDAAIDNLNQSRHAQQSKYMSNDIDVKATPVPSAPVTAADETDAEFMAIISNNA